MASNKASASLPALPTEIWIRVLENLRGDQDLPELWTSYRHVNTTFREASETIFQNHILPKTCIRFHLGTFSDEDHGMVDLDSAAEYLRLSDDKTKALFKLEAGYEDVLEEFRTRLQHCIAGMGHEFGDTEHSIQIRCDVTDGPIPGLFLDLSKLEFSCDWREFFTVFYGEQRLYHKLLAAWVKEQDGWADNLRTQMETGKINMETFMEQAVGAFASSHDKALKKARRARIRLQYKQLDGTDWDAEIDGDLVAERKALKRLADIRYMASFEDFSDDEEEEEEEEDEWEDEDEDETGDEVEDKGEDEDKDRGAEVESDS